VKIRAPAKINLGLRVLGKRKDGYHLIDTIMVPVSLYDEIEITRAKPSVPRSSTSIEVTCDYPLVPEGRENLVYRAAALLIAKSEIDVRLHIHIRKKIPVGAGLGGGSSDAAATMLALNRLLRLNLRPGQLGKLSASLGADVPFFIYGRPARARGIGNELSFLRRLPLLWAVILYPRFPISTAWVYGKFKAKLTKFSANNSINLLLRSADGVRKLLVNDLEIVTISRYPQIGLLKAALKHEGAIGAVMSGSGSSVFGIFNSRERAEKAFRRLRKMDGPQAFLVRIINRQVDSRAR